MFLFQLSQFGQFDVEAEAEVDAALDLGPFRVFLLEQLVSLSLELVDLLQKRVDGLAAFDLCRKRLELSRKKLKLFNRQAVLGVHNAAGSGANLMKQMTMKIINSLV